MDADALSGNVPAEISLGSPCVRLRHVGPESAYVTDRINAPSPRASSGYWGRHSGSE